MSYIYRVFAFALLVIMMIVYDRIRPTKGRFRTKEYLFLVLSGIVGTAYGVINDCFTAKISPEYFYLGKGLENGPYLYWHSLLIGAEAGLSGGIVLGCIFLFCRTYLFPSMSFKRMIYCLVVPMVLGVIFAVIFPRILKYYDPYHFADELDGILTRERIDNLLFVWREHLGTYAGIFTGTVVTVIYHILKNRKSSEKICP